jgi:hypothetical protein
MVQAVFLEKTYPSLFFLARYGLGDDGCGLRELCVRLNRIVPAWAP